eukprot:6984118-Prymnesium_polylepis.1
MPRSPRSPRRAPLSPCTPRTPLAGSAAGARDGTPAVALSAAADPRVVMNGDEQVRPDAAGAS